jgi:prophage antirepressor-like protein
MMAGAVGTQTFSFHGQEIRTVTDGGQVWFIVTDVAKGLGIGNPSEILSGQVDEADTRKVRVDTLGGPQKLLAVNFSGVYEIILGSRSQVAKEFEAWFSGEVMKKLGLPVPG